MGLERAEAVALERLAAKTGGAAAGACPICVGAMAVLVGVRAVIVRRKVLG